MCVCVCIYIYIYICGLPGGSVVKNPPASAGDVGVEGVIPGSGRSPGEGNGNTLQYSYLENQSHGQKSLVGYSPWGCKVSDTSEHVCVYVCVCMCIYM